MDPLVQDRVKEVRTHRHPGQPTHLIPWLAVVISAYVALILALGAPHLFGSDLRPGSVARRDYYATQSAYIIDETETHALRDIARQKVLPIFKKIDDSENQRILKKLDVLLARVSVIQSSSVQDALVEKHVQEILQGPTDVDPELAYLARNLTPQKWQEVSRAARQATDRNLQIAVLLPGDDKSKWQSLVLEFLPDTWDQHVRESMSKVIVSILEPNVVIDTHETKIVQEAAASQVTPVFRRVNSGDLLVSKGSVISPEVHETLESMGLTSNINLPTLISLCLSLLAAFAFVGLFLHNYEPEFLYSPNDIGLLALVSVVTTGIAAFAGQDYPQFIPVPAAALVLTIFLGPRVATVITVLIMIFLRVDGLIDVSDLIALGTGSVVAIGIHIKDRKELMIRGALVGAMQAVGYLVVVLITHSSNPSSVGSFSAIGQQLILHLLGGLSSCIVAIGSLPFLENIFGMITPFRIAELTDPDQPLLRQLEEKAPGTYQHSLAVANLAEAGAKAIGADVNLARAGSLYHDIGKMVQPANFIENQLGGTNPHDSLTPEESRSRVLAHVTNGIELAQKYGLPPAVEDFVPQHQGTTLMAYFYHKACLRDGIDKVDPQAFRYPGPKPQSREAAIVMLADVSEAVTHAMKDPSQEEVEQGIGSVFKARWDDGQFNESTLTPEELKLVQNAFVRVWRTLHHERLKYPSTTSGIMPVPPDPSRIAGPGV
jgi:putative nucleotidyltransferase with HDIG domain